MKKIINWLWQPISLWDTFAYVGICVVVSLVITNILGIIRWLLK